MKTKYLKKWRKEASNKYCVHRVPTVNGEEYHIMEYYDGNWYRYTSKDKQGNCLMVNPFTTLKDAKLYVDTIRREYVYQVLNSFLKVYKTRRVY